MVINEARNCSIISKGEDVHNYAYVFMQLMYTYLSYNLFDLFEISSFRELYTIKINLIKKRGQKNKWKNPIKNVNFFPPFDFL